MTDVSGIAIGAAAGFFASYLMERVKRRSALNDASRKAYASWFTAEASILRRVDTVCRKLIGFPTDPGKHDALVIEIASLVEDGRTLITTMNEAFLTEKSRRVRNVLSKLHTYLVDVVET